MLKHMRPMKTLAATAALTAGMSLFAPAAHADAIDQALAKLPAGEITCEQATSYWTNESDYNAKVSQARALAAFDSRGPQILAALARVDEAANRCGLKGGVPANTNPAPANTNTTPAPAQANTGAQVAIPVPAGTPTVTVAVPNVATFTLPDLGRIVANFFAQLGSSF